MSSSTERSSRSANLVTVVATTFAVSPVDRDRADPRHLGPLPDRQPARVAVADRGPDRGAQVAAVDGQIELAGGAGREQGADGRAVAGVERGDVAAHRRAPPRARAP